MASKPDRDYTSTFGRPSGGTPGAEGMPTAEMLDRRDPNMRAYVRTGDRTTGITRGIRTIQDQEDDRR